MCKQVKRDNSLTNGSSRKKSKSISASSCTFVFLLCDAGQGLYDYRNREHQHVGWFQIQVEDIRLLSSVRYKKS